MVSYIFTIIRKNRRIEIMVLVIVTDTGHEVGVIANDKTSDNEYIKSMVDMNNEYYGCQCELREV